MQQTQETNGAHSQLQIRREGSNFLDKLVHYLFCIQFIAITGLACFLTVRGFVSSHHFHPKEWYLPILSSSACAGVVSFLFQEFASLNPRIAIKTAFWIGPLLTCAFGVLLVLIGTPGSFAAAVVALVSAVVQSLYGCWVSPRLYSANRIVNVSIAYRPPKVRAIVLLFIITCTLYMAFLISSIWGAAGMKIGPLFVFLILASFIWTMQIAKNVMYVTISHIKYMKIANGIEIGMKTAVRTSVKYEMGSICIGSITVPAICVVTGLARSVKLVSGDVDEFMFSCADCCSGVAAKLVMYGNRWGFVQVGVYNKGIAQASKDTWEMYKRTGIEKLIDSDLTSSFCFLCGVATGCTCALVGGIWALVIHKAHAVEASLYTFLIGYFMGRVAVAWIQASVAAYYVAYAENPQSQQFDTTIPDYMQMLRRLEA